VVAETPQGCRISRSFSPGYVVTDARCPGRHWQAPNLPTAFALCQAIAVLCEVKAPPS
jgi:hypothetical protein